MDPDYRTSHLSTEGRRLIDLASANLTTQVPACPDWDCAQLLVHIGSVWNYMAMHVEQLALERLPRSEAPSPDDRGEVTYAEEAFARIVSALESADPGAAVWAWAGDGTVAFYLRRMHQESMVHRIDTEQAVGVASEIDALDAADGVDELVRVMLPASSRPAPSGSIHLHQTDGPGEWMLEPDDGRVASSIGHAKGDVAIRATAADLLMALWQRRPLEGLEIFGDRSIAEEWMNLSA